MKKKSSIISIISDYRPPKFVIILLLSISIVFCFIKNMTLDNDTWFLLNHGRYVLEHGIPHIEPFTIHSGFHFVMQQWAFSVVLWLIYKYLGKIGIILFALSVLIVIDYIVFKLCMMISDNKYYLSSVLTIILSIFLGMLYIVTRPQTITSLILIIELYLLEMFVHKKTINICILSRYYH